MFRNVFHKLRSTVLFQPLARSSSHFKRFVIDQLPAHPVKNAALPLGFFKNKVVTPQKVVLKNFDIAEVNFMGGGGKGFAYLGFLRALQEQGILKNIKCVSGTSAGAIFGLPLAFGMGNDSVKLLELFFGDEIFLNILNEISLEEISSYVETGFENDGIGLGEKLLSFKNFIKKIVAQGAYAGGKNLQIALENMLEKFILEADVASPGLADVFEDLRHPTFVELEYVRQKFPCAGFRSLSVALTNQKGERADANSRTMPNVSITIALLASAAIPGLFPGVKIKESLFYDGGLRQNIGAMSGLYPAQNCLVVGFKPELKMTRVINGFFSEVLYGVNHQVMGDYTFSLAKNNVYGHFVGIPHGELKFFDLPPKKEIAEQAILLAYDAAKLQLSTLVNASDLLLETSAHLSCL